ncbi:extracellular mutant protein 11-domain-containing protein [Aspergillus aurantiobrunneus]
MALLPSASAFSLPVPLWQQDPSLRVTRYGSRKRKKQYDIGEDESDDDNGDDGETTDAVSDIGLTNPSIILSPEEAGQYRVAGLAFDEELPGGQFPHGPVKERNRKLSTLSPPVYVPQSAAHQGNLRLHHLAVLTSVLHRCLLERDYIRAGRAWGLLIREQFKGKPIDVRTEDRWGIGAEILLRRDYQMSGEAPERRMTGNKGPLGLDTFPKLLFTKKGFEDAINYYETLITQYPYQKSAPDAISALHFYPAMFGLWIYVAQEESAAARRALEERDPASLREGWDDEDAMFDDDGRDDWWENYQRLTAKIREQELAEAQMISVRMDESLTSPPYSDSPELLELRGMVSQWVADLLVSSLPSGDSNDNEVEDTYGIGIVDGDNDVFMSATRPDNVEARQERRAAMEKREMEIVKSKEFMDKAQQRRQGENRQHQPLANDTSIQSRRAIAEQARVEVPQTTLVAPIPISTNRQAPIDRYGSPFPDQGPTENVGIDESTIAATSVIGGDEIPYRLSPAIHANASTTAQQQLPPQPSPSPPRKLRTARRDRALKSAGFDSDELDDTSQLTSTAGDDEQYRAAEEPLSRRLQNFWSAKPSKPQSFIPVASAAPKPVPASSRKVNLTRSMTTTPRTRFSPPKPSLLDQLDITPTRRSPGVNRTNSRKERKRERERERENEASKTADDFLRDTDEGLGLFRDINNNNHTRADDGLQSLNVFDMTNFDDLENDSSMNDPFSRRTSIRRVGTDTPHTKKRHLEPDYPPEILCTKTFSELQAEPFDHTPTPKASKSAKETKQISPEKGTEEDKISFLLRLSEQERAEYFAKLSLNEWEECGDLLIEQFSRMMSKMKDLRHARRKTAAVFEAEIKRRHEMVEEQSAEITGKFEEMRAGGAEVLRGRSP